MTNPLNKDFWVVSDDAKDGLREDIAPYLQLEMRVAAGMMDLCKDAFMTDAVDVYQVRLTRVPGGWLGMVKGERRGTKLVAWFNCETYTDVLREMSTQIEAGYVFWRLNKPSPWKSE